jgi:hypothetical protein
MNSLATVARAFFYLQALSLYNLVRQRLRRLRQPKYLFGALAGIAYFYFFVFRNVIHGRSMGSAHAGAMPPEMLPLLAGIAAAILMVFVVIAWLLPNGRAALAFTEAEVAFLFPAPLSRVALIQFSLLRSQLAIFFSAFLMSLLLRRGGTLGGSALQHAFAIWLLLATVRLHFIGASFARERLLDFGVRPYLRRVGVVALVGLILFGCWWWMRAQLPAPGALADFRDVARYVGTVLATPPLAWVLVPFKALIAPFFAVGRTAFLQALLPALALLIAHYLWVVRSHVSFEEASIDRARRRAERSQARRDGRSGLRSAPSKPRSAPFRLASRGAKPIAFLWKGLIAAGPFWRLRSFLLSLALVIAGTLWLGADPSRRGLLTIVGSGAGMLAVWSLLAGPMFMQRGLRRTFEYLDVLKASPVRGWEIALGELLSPMAMMAFAQWLLLLTFAMSFAPHASADGVASGPNIIAGAIGAALLTVPLCGVMLCLPFAGMLVFPAWALTAGGRDAGVEVVGQRMIFFGAYLLTMAIALLPAALVGGLVFFLFQLFASMAASVLVAALCAAIVLAVELAGAVWWLGERIDGIDVALELRQ